MTADGEAAAMMTQDARRTPAAGEAADEEEEGAPAGSESAEAAWRLSRLLKGDESNRPNSECGGGCVAVMLGITCSDWVRRQQQQV